MIGDRGYEEEVISRTCALASFLCSASNCCISHYPQAPSTGFSPDFVAKSPANTHLLAGNLTIRDFTIFITRPALQEQNP